MRRRKLWGWDVYVGGGIIVSVHLSIIVAKFFGKDLGVAIPDSLKAIQDQIELIFMCYMIMRTQKQTNNAHQRVTKVKKDVGITS